MGVPAAELAPPSTEARATTLTTDELRNFFRFHDEEGRRRVRKLFSEQKDIFTPRHDLTMEQQRELVMRRWDSLAQQGFFDKTITSRDPRRHLYRLAITEECEMLDHSLSVKMGVHYGLFGSAVAGLGDASQARTWLRRAESREVIGCYALSELGAGSNVRGIRTEAHFRRACGDGQRSAQGSGFVLHTPSDAAQKYWIGGAAESATHAAVFAQLYDGDGVHRGIHAFVVRLRDERGGKLCDGITVADCGHKWGLNGVDNGRLWFDNVWVPRENLLCRLSQVDENGVFHSEVADDDQRFGMTLAALTGGRVSIVQSGVNGIKLGVTIAIRYARSREVFNEQLMRLQTHQLRLLPHLCAAVTLQTASNQLKRAFYLQAKGHVDKRMHVSSSGLKALATWQLTRCLQECREACGGQGMLSENRVGPLLSEFNVCLTFEGDNHVLVQQVARAAVLDGKGDRAAADDDADIPDGEVLERGDGDGDDDDDAVLDFAVDIARRRVRSLRREFVRRGQRGEARGGAPPRSQEAAKAQLVLYEEIGMAHTDELLFSNVAEEIRKQSEGAAELARILRRCALIFALYRVDQQPSYLRTKSLSAAGGWRVRDALVRRCRELDERGDVDVVLHAFDLPEQLLAPIAGDWMAHNARARL